MEMPPEPTPGASLTGCVSPMPNSGASRLSVLTVAFHGPRRNTYSSRI